MGLFAGSSRPGLCCCGRVCGLLSSLSCIELFSGLNYFGMIIGQTNLPLVHEGSALFNLAVFKPIPVEKSEPDEEHLDDISPWVET